MRLGRWHVGRLERGREYADPVKPPPSGASGKDDADWFGASDVIQGGPDVNPELRGRQKFEIYNEMRFTDPSVKSVLWMFKLPIRAAEWSVEPAAGGKDPTDREVAEIARWQFGLDEANGRLDLSWDESLAQALLHLDFGAMFEEIVWGDPERWRDEESGSERIIRPVWRLAPRFPATISKIDTDERTGLIRQIEQDVPGARPITGRDLVWYALEREGVNWFGTSLLRAMYGSWRLKKALMISAAIGWDRWAAGLPVVRHPPGKKKEADEIGRNVRGHERAWVSFEGGAPPAGDWDIEIKGGSGTLSDPVPLLRYYDTQISRAGLQMMADLGTTDRGSRAVGEVLQDPYYLAVQAIAKHVATQRARQVLKEFVAVNYGSEVEVPEIVVSKIQAKNIPVLARAIADLTAAGFSFTDRETQDDVRDQMDLRHLPEEAKEKVKETVGKLPEEVGVKREGDAVAA